MPNLYIAVGPHTVEISSPDAALDPVALAFPDSQRTWSGKEPIGCIHVRPAGEDSWILASEGMPDTPPQSRGEVFPALADRCWSICKAHSDTSDLLLEANAVGWGETAVLVIGSDRSGASFLTCWMIEKGFSLISDQKLLLSGQDELVLSGLTGPISIDVTEAGQVARLPSFEGRTAPKVGDRRLFMPDATWVPPSGGVEPALICFVEYDAHTESKITFVPAQDTYDRLSKVSENLSEEQALTLRSLSEKTPALHLNYNAYSSIDHLVDQLAFYAAETRPSRDAFQGFVSHMRIGSNTAAPTVFDIPDATDRDLTAKLTIGMATYDDYDGVYFSIQSIRLHHPEILDQVEFLVIDNHPDGVCAEALKRLENSIPNYRYIPEKDMSGTAVRDLVFKNAIGEFVMCIDCHVLFEPGALSRLLEYLDENAQTQDLLQGPMIPDDLDFDKALTHFEPIWSSAMYGRFACSDTALSPDDPPFDIPMQGLGVFACRRDCWPGFNKNFRGFGGEEGYIHQKFRNLGRRTLCLPFLRWLHRFGRPLGVPYVISWEDRVRNYWIGWNEVGLPLDPMKDHFSETLGIEKVEQIIAAIEME